MARTIHVYEAGEIKHMKIPGADVVVIELHDMDGKTKTEIFGLSDYAAKTFAEDLARTMATEE